jgi:ADP-ribose pyrophosphatase YjhB (NUDIX family)
MTDIPPPKWLDWAQTLQAISQIGLHFAENHYQTERFQQIGDIAAEIMAQYTNLGTDEILRIFDEQVGYATPKIDVRSAVFQDNKLLLVKEIQDGRWTLPGGWVDVGDTPSGAAERETLEESGFIVKARRVVGVYDANRVEPLQMFHAFKIVFLCDITGGSSKISDETSDVKFFAFDEIPETFSGYRTTRKHIQDVFAMMKDPNRPTIFD